MRKKAMAEALRHEKAGVLERLGGQLSVGGVDLVGALAYAQINPNTEEHEERDAAQIDPRTELAAILVRLKHGQDRTVALRSALLLERWVTHQRAFRHWKLKPWQSQLLGRFVRITIGEWVNPVCLECSGRELVGLDRGEIIERRVKCQRCGGRGTLHERPVKRGRKSVALGGGSWCHVCNTTCSRVTRQCPACGGAGRRTHAKVRQRKTEQCSKCKGTGLRIPGDMERALALGVDVRVYQRHWERRFSWLHSGLDRLDHLAKRCLQSQLSAGITRA